jgi:predicted AAA+ superfamily ATPase
VPLSPEAAQVLRDLNPWWQDPSRIRPEPPEYVRPRVREIAERIRKPKGLVEVIRGPRQVGKTTGLFQVVRDLLTGPGHALAASILYVRFDLELLRTEPGALRAILAWWSAEIVKRRLDAVDPAWIFLDEVHKLPRWSEEVKHLVDTFPARVVLTGSSSVLVARGGRESLAGRVFTTELPPFSFREVLECWHPKLAAALPPAVRFSNAFDGDVLRRTIEAIERLRPQQKLAIRRDLERYYNRGGYPRLHSGEVDDDRWADYLVQTVFENVLGADIPDLFPVENPGLLRYVYLAVARDTGREIAQNKLTQHAIDAGFPTNQPTVGKYLRYLQDALLIRELRRYPLARSLSARVPSKFLLSDLGVRNAIFRGAPSLWESDPDVVGPLVETLVQSVIRDVNLQVHFFRDHENPRDRRSPIHEVDFVAERIDGATLPIEVKFRRKIDGSHLRGLETFRARYDNPFSILVTRDRFDWSPLLGVLSTPLQSFLLAF